MGKSNIETRMNEEIRMRMKSRSWNLSMAASVLEKKKRRKKNFFLLSGTATSLAAVSLVISFLLFGTGERSVDSDYTDFISSQLKGTYESAFYDSKKPDTDPDKGKSFVAEQIRGTYNRVFGESSTAGTVSPGTRVILTSDIDSMIDNTLAQR